MAAYRLPLEPGTKVRRRWPKGEVAYREINPVNTGRVAEYDTVRWDGQPIQTNVGTFPVLWRNGITTTCGADDVIVVTESASEVEAA